MRANGQDSWRPAPVPETNSLAKVAAAAKECTACPLYKKATQTVFGEGPKHAAMFMIGEQPGDYEDVAGKPFVGPAGKILDRALEEAGINRDEVCCLSRLNRRSDNVWTKFSRHERTRQSSLVASRAKSCGNCSPFLAPA